MFLQKVQAAVETQVFFTLVLFAPPVVLEGGEAINRVDIDRHSEVMALDG